MAQHVALPSHWELNQDVARNLMLDHHYYAASRSLKSFLNSQLITSKQRVETEELLLICDYYLNTEETAERIEQWCKRYPRSAQHERLQLLKANLMVRDQLYIESLPIYSKFSGTIYDLNESEREETLICYAIALIQTDKIDEGDAIIQALKYSKSHQMDVIYCEGYIKYIRGDYKSALENFQILTNPTDYTLNIPVYMADCHLQLREPQAALALLNNQLPMVGNKLSSIGQQYSNEILRIRGEALYDLKNYSQAVASLQQYVGNEHMPKRTALYKLGMAQFQLQEYAKAANALSRSATIDKDELAQNSWLNAGICYVHSQNKRQAQIAFQQAAEMDANKQLQEEALYNYALTLHEGNTMGFGESVHVFERFLNLFPQSQYASSVSRHLVEVYFTTKNYQDALESINKIASPSAEILQAKQQVLYHLGAQQFIAGNYAEADAFLNQSIEMGSTEARYLKGESAYRQGKYQQAIDDLRKYVSVTPRNQGNYGQALYSIGYALMKQKNYREANNYFNTFVGTNTANQNTILKADALNRVADCLYSDRRYDDAYEIYERALRTNRQMGDYSLYQQAFIEGLRGNNERKVELLNRMSGEYVDSQYGADALYERGRAYIQTGAKNEALQTFNSLINRYPHSQKARSAGNEIGLIYFESGMTEEALKAYNSVIERYPDSEEAQTALANLKDIYTDMGKVNEYAALAQKVGKGLSGQELDEMLADAAVKSMTSGEYTKAYQHYSQLAAQTQSAEMLMQALEGSLRSAFEAKDYETTANVATQIVQNGKASSNLVAEALLYRAESFIALGNPSEGIKDLQLLSQDNITIYGAQANVRLAQYAYDTNQYQAAEEILQKFIESGTTHQYWLARAFILLSDVYSKTDRKVEAREYLLSLRSNYNENEEINRMIQERLK